MHNVYEYDIHIDTTLRLHSQPNTSIVGIEYGRYALQTHTHSQTHKNIKKKRMVKNYKSFGTEPFPHTSSKKQKEGKRNAILASTILYHIMPCRSLTTHTYIHTTLSHIHTIHI